MGKRKCDPELIVWLDHAEVGEGVWHDIDQARKAKPARFATLGWVIAEDDQRIVVISTMEQDGGTVSKPFVIIKSTVLDRGAVTLAD